MLSNKVLKNKVSREVVVDVLIRYLLPVGLLVLLTGFFWVSDRSLYHRLYYALIVAPTVIISLLQPSLAKKMLKNPLIISIGIFSVYMLVTLLWSDSHKPMSLLKRPFYILALVLGLRYLAFKSSTLIPKIFHIASIVAACSGFISLGYFYYVQHSAFSSRFSGYGILENPLLTSHVFGFFAVFWLATIFSLRGRKAFLPILLFSILFAVVLSTGSRTPLLALFGTVVWLSVCSWDKRSVIAMIVLSSVVVLTAFIFPELLTHRGLSHRPEIWLQTLTRAMDSLWFGYGLDCRMPIDLNGLPSNLCDPHNIELAVLLSGGVIGLLLWMLIYGLALGYSWLHRDNMMVFIASGLIIYGLIAGLTEGRSFFSRPKEHWFLIWIPLALMSSIWLPTRRGVKDTN